MPQILRRVWNKLWHIADKPRQLVFKLPYLHNLPLRLQRWLYFVLSPLALTTIFSIYLFWGLPFPTQITSQSLNPVSTQILDRNGKLVYEIFEEKRRSPVDIDELPKYVGQATVAIEDKDFYKHFGLDFRGLARALFKTTTAQGVQGGSTITQQLVKTTLLTPERTIKRKIREIALTLIVEIIYSKDKILEMYLNNVPYGGTSWGIEAASQNYFGKSARELTLAQAALLAGLPQRPTSYSPFGAHPELAQERQKLVLKKMAEEGYISEDQEKQAEKEEIKYATKNQGLKAPHFSLFVKDQLVEKYGEDLVEHGGLRVKTTLDLELQEFAQNLIKNEIAKLKRENVGNGAAIVTNPKNGEIYAMVGSKDYFAEDEDGKVNIVLAQRQPGSSIKPLNYALALRDGKITASTSLADIPTCFTTIGQPPYCPLNYDGSFRGAVQARFALANSLNIPAVRVLALNGLPEFVDFAKKMGISTFTDPVNYGLSLTLGGGEVRMIDMAQAFGVFANLGLKQNPIAILEVSDWKGKVLEKTEITEGDRVLPQDVAFLISHILLDNNARSQVFGTTSYLNVGGHPEVSVKTGTTNDKRDNWTIGFSPEVVVATWVGNNDNQPMSRVASGVTGASPIWNKIIKFALDRIENGDIAGFGKTQEKHAHIWPEKPADVLGTSICTNTGALPEGASFIVTEQESSASATPNSAGFCSTRFEYFLQDHPPQTPTLTVEQILTFKDTGMPAPPDADPEAVEPKDHSIIIDPLGTQVCLDCPVAQNWSVSINTTQALTVRGREDDRFTNLETGSQPYGGRSTPYGGR